MENNTSDEARTVNAPEEQPVAQIAAIKPARKNPKLLWIILCAVVLCGILAAALIPGISGQRQVSRYNQGAEYLEQGDYEQAREVFLALGEYEDAPVLVVYAEKGIAYTAAKESLEREDFSQALEGFAALSGFKDSEDLAEECWHAWSYEKGKALYEEGNYAAALEALETAEGYGDSPSILKNCRFFLLQQDIADAMERGDYAQALSLIESEDGEGLENREAMIAECNMGIQYAEAEEAFDNELFYTAYGIFHDLGSYRDALSRAEACVLSKPSTGEIYHNSAYTASGCSLKINPNTNDGSCTYFKIYTVSGAEEILVSCVFINSGATATVHLPAGTYILKTATSSGNWYGEKEMFGSNGVYQRLQSSDSSDRFTLERYGDYVLTLSNATNGNVGSQRENRDNF